MYANDGPLNSLFPPFHRFSFVILFCAAFRVCECVSVYCFWFASTISLWWSVRPSPPSTPPPPAFYPLLLHLPSFSFFDHPSLLLTLAFIHCSSFFFFFFFLAVSSRRTTLWTHGGRHIGKLPLRLLQLSFPRQLFHSFFFTQLTLNQSIFSSSANSIQFNSISFSSILNQFNSIRLTFSVFN